LTLEQLGKVVAIELRWPLLLDDLEAEPTLLRSLQNNEAATEQPSASSRLLFWNTKNLLKELIVYPCSDSSGSTEHAFRLDRVDVSRLLHVSPPVPGRGFPERAFSRAPWNPVPDSPRPKGTSAEELRAKRESNWESTEGSSEGSGVKPSRRRSRSESS